MKAMQTGKLFTTSTDSISIMDGTGDPICGLLCEEDSAARPKCGSMVEAGTG
jgi:hypothetical protein